MVQKDNVSLCNIRYVWSKMAAYLNRNLSWCQNFTACGEIADKYNSISTTFKY
jgi:hypothetical protein